MKILLAFDGSDYALRAARYLIKLKKDTPAADITVIVVSEIDEKIEEFLSSSKLCQDLREAYHKQSRETMEKALDVFRSEGIETAAVIKQGLPSKEIAAFAAEGNFDMIVMGKHGMNDFKGILIGSNTRQAISLSNCPVLVVK